MHRAVLVAWVAAVVLASGRAEAQLHGDLDAEAGVAQRLLSSRPPGGPNADVGPMFEVSGRLAVLPLLRAGAYVSFDLAPVEGAGAREFLAAGFTARVYSPWPRGTWRAWLALGFGYDASHAPPYAGAQAESGGFFEIPLGVGASARLSRRFELVGDLAARIGFGFTGSMYNQASSGAVSPALSAGNDFAALSLMLGAAFEL